MSYAPVSVRMEQLASGSTTGAGTGNFTLEVEVEVEVEVDDVDASACLRFAIEEIVASGQHVAVRASWHGTHRSA
jgi:hypothetical protein